MNSNTSKRSISTMLIGISLAGMLVLVLTISVFFVTQMRSLTTSEIETSLRNTVYAIRDRLQLTFRIHEDALFHSMAGINLLYRQTGETFLSARAINEHEMHRFLTQVRGGLPYVSQVFVANNIPTYLEGGYAVFSPEWRFPGDYDQRTRPWFIGAKSVPGRVYFSDPYWAMATGLLTTSLSTTIFDGDNDLGVIALDISVANLTDIVASMGTVDGQYIWLLNSEGLYISSEDPDAVMTVNFFDDHGLSRYMQSILGSDIFFDYVQGGGMFLSSARIPGVDWIVVSIIPTAVIFAELNRAIISSIVLAAFLIVSIVIVLVFVIRRISKPIVTVADALKEISHGNLNMSRTIALNSKNEIGVLADCYNLTLNNVGNLVGVIKNKVNSLVKTSSDLSTNMQKTSNAVTNISSKFTDMKGLESKQTGEAEKANAAMAEIKTSIEKLKKLVEEQTGNVNTSSTAIEQMTANIHSVTKTLVENTKNVDALAEASESGKSGLQAVAEKIQEIARDSEGLLEINSVMENIASQTNLLSMNAAIEAAHAGESGRGFAVVADEIRKLAESSSEQSKTTTAMLKKIKTSIDSITKSSDEVLERFSVIDLGVKTVSDHEQNIRAAMEEQESGGRQILASVGRLRDITMSVQRGSEDMSESGDELIKKIHEFISISSQVVSGMNDIVSGAIGEIQGAVNQVDEISVENNNYFNELKGEVEKFRLS